MTPPRKTESRSDRSVVKRIAYGASLVLILCSFAAFAVDMSAMLGGQGGGFTLLGDLWFQAHRASLNGLQAGIQRYVAAGLWDPGITTILRFPAWMAFGIAAAPFLAAGALFAVAGAGSKPSRERRVKPDNLRDALKR